jgi:proton-translocating NADH-quinone oxidoreductase chain M
VSFVLTLYIFLLSLWLLFYFENFKHSFQFQVFIEWSEYLNIYYSLGLDGISLFFIILTTFLMPICFLISWVSICYRLKEFVICMLLTEFFLIHVFSVLDLFFFYLFFESILLPMFLIIGVWGSRQRKIHATYQFFFYTLIGSLLMLVSIIYIYIVVGTSDLSVILIFKFNHYTQIFLWIAFFLSLAVKIPMVPFHIWLPEAHVEAPTSGSVILAGLLLKMGGYAILRFMIPIFDYANFFFMPFVFMLSIIAIIFSSLATIRQVDLKKIIAYSSVAHMNYVTLGLFSYDLHGLQGCIFLMLSHGLVSSALFISVGILYDRYKTRILKYYGGLVQLMPILSFFFFFFTLSNMSFPGTSSFIGELLILLSCFLLNTEISLFATSGMILNGIYAIWLFNRIFFGVIKANNLSIYYSDINKREFFVLFLFFIFILFFGVFPNFILDYISYSCLFSLFNLHFI